MSRTLTRSFGAGAFTLALLLGITACGSSGSTTSGPDTAVVPGGNGSEGSNGTDEEGGAPDTGAKKVFKEDQTDIRIGAGEKFAIRLPQNPSIGDAWKLVSEPDDSFVKYDGESFKADADRPGAGGQEEFKFKAKKAGTTTVTMFNCYRCSGGTVAPENSQYAKRITFTITVG